jgi:hypothetical protein
MSYLSEPCRSLPCGLHMLRLLTVLAEVRAGLGHSTTFVLVSRHNSD